VIYYVNEQLIELADTFKGLGFESESEELMFLVKESQLRPPRQLNLFNSDEIPEDYEIDLEEQIPMFTEHQMPLIPTQHKQKVEDSRFVITEEDLELLSGYSEPHIEVLKELIKPVLEANEDLTVQDVIKEMLELIPEENNPTDSGGMGYGFDVGVKYFRGHHPELAANPPSYIPGQEQLPGMPITPRFIPDHDVLEDERLGREKEFAAKKIEFNKSLELFKKERGREPNAWELSSISQYKYSDQFPSNYYGTKPIKPEDIKVSDAVSPQEYQQMEKKLLDLYNRVEAKRKLLYEKVDEAKGYSIPQPQDVSADSFEKVDDMLYDLRDRIHFVAQEVILNSAGESIFGSTNWI